MHVRDFVLANKDEMICARGVNELKIGCFAHQRAQVNEMKRKAEKEPERCTNSKGKKVGIRRGSACQSVCRACAPVRTRRHTSQCRVGYGGSAKALPAPWRAQLSAFQCSLVLRPVRDEELYCSILTVPRSPDRL